MTLLLLTNDTLTILEKWAYIMIILLCSIIIFCLLIYFILNFIKRVKNCHKTVDPIEKDNKMTNYHKIDCFKCYDANSVNSLTMNQQSKSIIDIDLNKSISMVHENEQENNNNNNNNNINKLKLNNRQTKPSILTMISKTSNQFDSLKSQFDSQSPPPYTPSEPERHQNQNDINDIEALKPDNRKMSTTSSQFHYTNILSRLRNSIPYYNSTFSTNDDTTTQKRNDHTQEALNSILIDRFTTNQSNNNKNDKNRNRSRNASVPTVKFLDEQKQKFRNKNGDNTDSSSQSSPPQSPKRQLKHKPNRSYSISESTPPDNNQVDPVRKLSFYEERLMSVESLNQISSSTSSSPESLNKDKVNIINNSTKDGKTRSIGHKKSSKNHRHFYPQSDINESGAGVVDYYRQKRYSEASLAVRKQSIVPTGSNPLKLITMEQQQPIMHNYKHNNNGYLKHSHLKDSTYSSMSSSVFHEENIKNGTPTNNSLASTPSHTDNRSNSRYHIHISALNKARRFSTIAANTLISPAINNDNNKNNIIDKFWVPEEVARSVTLEKQRGSLPTEVLRLNQLNGNESQNDGK
jgi:hypothetical protein